MTDGKVLSHCRDSPALIPDYIGCLFQNIEGNPSVSHPLPHSWHTENKQNKTILLTILLCTPQFNAGPSTFGALGEMFKQHPPPNRPAPPAEGGGGIGVPPRHGPTKRG